MNKDFLNWQLTNTLHSIGYNGDTFLWIDDEEDIINDSSVELIGGVKAILYSQAFRWFREKYGLFCEISLDTYSEPNPLKVTICEMDSKRFYVRNRQLPFANSIGAIDNDKYEEAELACLRKLIEIVKEKQR